MFVFRIGFLIMKLRINNIQLDTSMVLGTYCEVKKDFVTLDKPVAVMQFIRHVIRDLVRPNSNHRCSVSCRELTTIVLGAPFHKNLREVAPE